MVPYAIRRSTRARHVRLRIDLEPHVEIVVPTGMPLPDVERLLLDSERWILRHLPDVTKTSDWTPLEAGSMLSVQGVDRVVVIEVGPPEVTLTAQALIVRCRSDEAAVVRAALLTWYRAKAREILAERVTTWEACMGVQHARLTVRDQRSRWGSCSSRGSLSFSWRLILAPPPILDYVVIHELAHLRELNHGARFWEIVEHHCPEYAERRRWLRQHGPRLSSVLSSRTP
jgi:predicted metal-dependent hydrolase